MPSSQTIDRQLALHSMYGDPFRCISERESVYLFLLDIASGSVPAASDLRIQLEAAPASSRARILRSPVFQATVNQIIRDVFSASATSERAPQVLTTLASCVAMADEGDHPVESREALPLWRNTFIWDDDHSQLADELRRLFVEQVLREPGRSTIDLRSPDERMRGVLRRGFQLAGEILPNLMPAMFEHVSLVGIVDDVDVAYWTGNDRPHLFESGSSDGLPGILFLTPNALVNEWVAAEALFHEAGHQKLFDLIKTKRIYQPNYSGERAKRIPCPWRLTDGRPDLWITDRAFLAFHVYVYLAVYYRAVQERTNELELRFALPPTVHPAEAFREAADRAHYLGHMVRIECAEDLATDGKQLVEWLQDTLDSIVDEPLSLDEARSRVALQQPVGAA